MCPYCGRDFAMHGGALCPLVESAMVRTLREAVAFLEDQRSEKARTLALSQAVTPRVVPVDNGAGNAQLLCSFNLNRGAAIIYNDNAEDVYLGEDRQHIEDATKRFALKGLTALTFTSPAELWGIGSVAGPQLVYVLELPPGRAASEFAALATLV